jgi:hypothetical protein
MTHRFSAAPTALESSLGSISQPFRAGLTFGIGPPGLVSMAIAGFISPSACRRQVEGEMTVLSLSATKAWVAHSSPLFGLSEVVADPTPALLVIRSISTCLRQVEGAMTRRRSPWMQGPEGRPPNVSPARKGWEIDPKDDPSAVGAAPNRCVMERSRGICSSADLSWKCFPPR